VGPARSREPCAKVGLAPQAHDPVCNGGRIVGRDEHAVLEMSDLLGYAADLGCDHGNTGRHCLQGT
jgi:hypothetical protein